MRVIKFRAYLEITNTMAYMDEKPLWVFLRGVHGCPLMQSTGLKDKNGVEIYEGDIIKHHFNNDHLFSLTIVVYGIQSNLSGELHESIGFLRVRDIYNFFTKKNTDIRIYECATSMTYGLSTYEVIGNIHQTPAK